MASTSITTTNGYEVTYNFNIHVPRDTELRLRNVNGEIKTEQTGGKFDISGVNGHGQHDRRGRLGERAHGERTSDGFVPGEPQSSG